MKLPIVLAAATLLLAGCTDPAKQAQDAAEDQAAALSDSEAQATLKAAMASMPAVYGMRVTLAPGAEGAQPMTALARFDNGTKDLYAKVTGGATSFVADPAEGISMLVTQRGMAATTRGTIFTASQTPALMSGILPDSVIRPDELLLQMAQHVDVTGVTPVDEDTVDVAFRSKDEQGDFNAKARMDVDPVRILSFEASYPREGRSGLLAGGSLKGEMLYGADAPAVPDALTRALGLGIRSDPSGAGESWRFSGASGVPASEIEAVVQVDGSASPRTADTKLRMPLSEGTLDQDGVTIAFTDADGDGAVGEGDSIAFTEDGASFQPRFLLYDTVSGAYVTPEFALLLTR